MSFQQAEQCFHEALNHVQVDEAYEYHMATGLWSLTQELRKMHELLQATYNEIQSLKR